MQPKEPHIHFRGGIARVISLEEEYYHSVIEINGERYEGRTKHKNERSAMQEYRKIRDVLLKMMRANDLKIMRNLGEYIEKKE